MSCKGVPKQYQGLSAAELRVHQNPDYSRDLLDYIFKNEVGYDAHVVDELCGWPHVDYRNLINFPRSQKTPSYSSLLDSILRLQMPFQMPFFTVNSKTIIENFYPCCSIGGECCFYESTDDKRQWHGKNGVKKPFAMQGFAQ
jgi:hypothetical protein